MVPGSPGISRDAPPYIVFLLAVEFTAGTLLPTYALHLHGLVTRRCVKVGGVGSLAALAVVGLTAAMFRLPAWGYGGVVLSLLLGGLSLGTVTMGMVLGHWYLVTPRLPEQPLNEATLGLLAVLTVQAALV